MINNEGKLKLALETGLSIRTIDKWLKRQEVSVSTNKALSKAASALGLRRENGDHEKDKAEK